MDRATAGAARPDWLIAALLFLACLVLYHGAPVRQLYDWRYITAVSHSLLHEGDFSVDPSMAERARYQIQPVGESFYHLFPNALAVANLPFVWVFERLGAPVFDDEGRFLGGNEAKILRAAAATATALTVAVLFLVGRLFLTPVPSVGLALLFAFGSPLLSTASRPFWSHCWGVLFLAVALYGILSPPGKWQNPRVAGAASAIAWAVFTRPTFALSALALVAVVAVRRRRSLPVFLAVGGVWLVVFTLYSLQVYGELVPPYFYSDTTATGRLTAGRLLGFHGEAALGTLFSPARGLFFFTPFLLAILYFTARAWRWLPDRMLAAVGLAVCIAHWHLVSSFRNWAGGASFGPRLFTDLMPWFLVLGALAMAGMADRPGAGKGRRWGPGSSLFVALLAAASLFVHIRGATERLGMRHYGIWNWRCPPFMIGLIPVPGLPLPGALLRYDANADLDPTDGWQNLTRRQGFDLALDASVTRVGRTADPAGIQGAFRFNGGGGGTTRTLQNLGGRPNVTEGPATFEIWFRPAAGADDAQVLLETGGGEKGLTLFVRERRPGLEVRSAGPGRAARLEIPVAVSSGRFSQLVAVLRPLPVGSELTLYLDGRRAAGPLAATGIDDWAGGDGTGVATDDANPSLPARDFVGDIAIVQFYRSALGPRQVAHNFRAVAAPPGRR